MPEPITRSEVATKGEEMQQWAAYEKQTSIEEEQQKSVSTRAQIAAVLPSFGAKFSVYGDGKTQI